MELIEFIKKRLSETTCECGVLDEYWQTHRTSCIRAQFIWLLDGEQ